MSLTRLEPGEKLAEANGLTLCYQTFGDPAAPPLVLIMGFASQMIWWEEDFCDALAARGFYVVRFDNRDVGKSSRFAGTAPSFARVMARLEPPPYTLDDMARDTVGLMDALGVASAHLVGASMGGMIAQIVAIAYPERVRTLTSIMSNTGERGLPHPRPEVMAALAAPPPTTVDGYVAANAAMSRLLRGYDDVEEDEASRRRARRAAMRGLSPEGAARQSAAVLSAPSRVAGLAKLKAPTLVIHGSDDPLVAFAGGEATARVVPGARLIALERMGHTLPRALWPTMIDAIAEHARSVE